MNPLLVHQVETHLYQTLALIPQYPVIPSDLDLTSQTAVTAYKESVKDWLKGNHPGLYKQPIIPELLIPNWAEAFGMNLLSKYTSLPELLVLAPHEVPYLRISLNYPCNWELELLKRHNAKFLAQLWKYFEGGRYTLLSPSEWEILVLIHDLGKPRAMERSYQQSLSKKQQKADNDEVREVFWSNIRPGMISQPSKAVINLVLDHDLLVYEYLTQSEFSPEAFLSTLEGFAQQLECDLTQLAQTFYTYHVCDGSTYTVEAGGQPSFDFQFVPRHGKLELWPPFANKWQAVQELLLR